MFTGIIESCGILIHVEKEKDNLHLTIQSELAHALKIDQSVAHDGVCLTVTAADKDTYTVTAIKETLEKSNLCDWVISRKINLERCLQVGARLDGHFVQGHVDDVVKCLSIEEARGSHVLTFSFDKKFGALLIEKGSVCLNGVSLTSFDVAASQFSVALIPYTFEHTNFNEIK